DTRASAVDWQWGESSNGNPLYRIIAKHMTQSSETDKAQLEDVELRIFQKDGKHYDRVRSPKAEFSTSTSKLYAPGEAEITLDIPIDGEPPHQPTSIKAAGINLDSKTGQAVTDQHVTFTFEAGDGSATGASYDPES